MPSRVVAGRLHGFPSDYLRAEKASHGTFCSYAPRQPHDPGYHKPIAAGSVASRRVRALTLAPKNMDPARNPYRPGAGTTPRMLAGRDGDIEEATTLARRVARGNPQRSIMFYGLRGVGKTVLLNEIERRFELESYIFQHLEISQNNDFRAVISATMRKILLQISGIEKAKDFATKGLRALKSFVLAIPDGPELRLDLEPLLGTADSGDLQADLVELFVLVGEAARASDRPVAIFADEAQYLAEEDLAALIASCHRISQRSLPLVVVCAGLPQISALAGDAKSYAERLFDFRPVDTLSEPDARSAIVEPAKEEGMTLSDEVIAVALSATERYPYFIQEFGKQLWDLAQDENPTEDEAREAEAKMIESLDNSFFKTRLDRATNGEKKFMVVLGRLGPGAQRISDLATALGKEVQSLGPDRANLIHKGFIYAPDHGRICFTVPHFDRFLARTFPENCETGEQGRGQRATARGSRRTLDKKAYARNPQ